MHKDFHVYILASVRRTLYVGVTSDLEGRIWQHKTKALHGFTSRYGIDRLVYVEEQPGSENAFAREKQIKGWSRAKKVELIEQLNPDWIDLSYRMFGWRARDFEKG